MRQFASLSLDLDNQWSYMKTHGDPGWEKYPTYLDSIVPRALELLDRKNLQITFFIVGRDAADNRNTAAIGSISAAGHEIGNHSFSHEPWLHLYSREQIVDEIQRTEEALLEVTGQRPVGFRGPGYSLSPTVIEVLGERGYEYDCSALPTFIAPLARAFYFLRSPEMSSEERDKRKQIFGKFSDGFQTLRPHYVTAGSRDIVEIPVTTFPGIKTPIHASYLLYLATFSKAAALSYWRAALAACRISGLQPSVLLHPLDFLSGDDVPELKFFPGMQMAIDKKLDIVGSILDILHSQFDIVGTREHARVYREGAATSSRPLYEAAP